MTAASIILPRRIHWPTVFWSRAEGSLADCDLLCRRCGGSGTDPSADLDDRWATVEGAACRSCRSSGLLVSASDLPSDTESLRASDAAGGCWLDWLGHTGGGLRWPAPWCWAVNRQRFPVGHDVYYSDRDVLAFMVKGSVLAGLHRPCEGGRRHLEAVFRVACGGDAEPPEFVMP